MVRRLPTVLIGPALIVTLLTACGTDPCATTLLSDALSQDGRVKAVAFLRNCGSTADYVTAVSLISPTQTLTDDGRFFTPHRLGNVFRAEGVRLIGLTWRSATELTIRYGPGTAPLLREASRGKIRLVYEELRAQDLETPQNNALKLTAPVR
jgi:hypothetical protein